MKELQKYSIRGSFLFQATDQLSKVCNAPGEDFKCGGIYIIYAERKGVSDLVLHWNLRQDRQTIRPIDTKKRWY